MCVILGRHLNKVRERPSILKRGGWQVERILLITEQQQMCVGVTLSVECK
jgi:hypothetical protein